MHDVTTKQAAVTPADRHPNFEKHHKHFPTTAWLRRRAPRNVPLFAFEYGDTGAGNDVGIEHNWAALDAVEIVPRYGVMPTLPPVEVKLFGATTPRRSAFAHGRAISGVAWRRSLMQAAQRARLHLSGRRDHHRAGSEAAPDVSGPALSVWHDDHKIGLIWCRAQGRSQSGGSHQCPVHHPVAETRRACSQFVPISAWSAKHGAAEMVLALLRHGYPRFATWRICASGASTNEIIAFARGHGRRVLEGQTLSRRLEGADGRKAFIGDAAKAIWCRRHLCRTMRPPDRSADADDRRAAGNCRGGRQESDRCAR